MSARGLMSVSLVAAVAVLAFGAPPVRAQYADPLACMPPAGQGMWEIAATNLARRYRSEPTAANKDAMCGRFRSTIEVYANAVEGCRRSTCKEASFRQSCARARDKAAFWRKRTKEEC